MSALRAYGQLLRLSLAPTAAADVAAGLVLGTRGEWLPGPAPWLLVLGSLGVYHGALALNDWSDRAGDAATRPERPLPAGVIPPSVALGVALALVAGGVLAAASVVPAAGAWMGGVALLAIGYDVRGRGPLLGPLLLGSCRAGNLAVGILAPAWIGGAAWPEHPEPLLLALLYGGYVFSVSRLGRLEDDEDPRPLGTRPRAALLAAAFCMAAVPLAGPLVTGTLVSVGVLASAVLAWGGAWTSVRAGLRTSAWEREDVGRAMGAALRRLLVFSAACAVLGAGTWGTLPAFVAAAILLGYPIAYQLRRVFPPT